MKKEWKTPQLVVVVRGSAEEKVLMGCKLPAGMAALPQLNDMSCLGLIPQCVEHCDTIMNS
jgi:hypothetical protein